MLVEASPVPTPPCCGERWCGRRPRPRAPVAWVPCGAGASPILSQSEDGDGFPHWASSSPAAQVAQEEALGPGKGVKWSRAPLAPFVRHHLREDSHGSNAKRGVQAENGARTLGARLSSSKGSALSYD